MVFEDLNVEVSADTASFTSSMEVAQSRLGEVADEALNAAGSLQFLQGRADEAGDEMAAAGRKGSLASAGMSAFSIGTDGASVSVIALSNALTLALIPALTLSLIPALVTLTGLLGAFAAITGSIGFSAIAAGAGAVATNTEQLKDAFQDIVQTIQSEFAPVFDYATGLLIRLSNILEDTISELVPSQSVIESVGTEFLNLGKSIIQTLPAFSDLAVTLTSEFLPPFVEFMQDILPDLPGLIQGLVTEFKSLFPVVKDFAEAVVDSLPQLNELGKTIIREVVPALERFFREVLTPENIQSIIDFGREMKPVITAAGDLATAAAGLLEDLRGLDTFMNEWTVIATLTALGAVLSGPGAVVATVLGLATAFNKVKENTKGGFNISAFIADLEGLSETITEFAGSVGQVIGNLVSGIVGSFTDLFRFLITSTTDALNTTYNAFQTAFNGILMVVEDIAESIVGTFTEGLNGVIRQINEAIDLASGAVPGFNMQTFDTVASPDLNIASGTQRQERVVVEERQEIEFSGDGEISEMFARQANDQFSQQRRQDERDLSARLPDS